MKYIVIKSDEFVEYVLDDIELLFDVIYDVLDLGEEDIRTTMTVYEDHDIIYELVYNSNKQECNDKLNITNGILLKEDICTKKILDIDYTDIEFLSNYKNNLFYLSINTEGTMQDLKININEKEQFNHPKYIKDLIKIKGLNLMFLSEEKIQNSTINKKATVVSGKTLYGNVLVFRHVDNDLNNTIVHMNTKIFMDLYECMDIIVDVNEMNDIFGDVQHHLNDLDKLHKLYKPRCHYCDQCLDQTNMLTCTGCLIVKYDSVECQKLDWNNHKRN